MRLVMGALHVLTQSLGMLVALDFLRYQMILKALKSAFLFLYFPGFCEEPKKSEGGFQAALAWV